MRARKRARVAVDRVHTDSDPIGDYGLLKEPPRHLHEAALDHLIIELVPFAELMKVRAILEKHFKDVQDVEL